MRNCDRATRAWLKGQSFFLAAFLLTGNSCGGGARFLATGRWLIVHLSVPSSAVRTPNQPFLLPSFLSRDVARSAPDPGTCGGQYPLTASTTIAPSVRPARRTRRSESRRYPVSPALCVMRRRREKSSETIAHRPSTSSFTPQARCHSHMVQRILAMRVRPLDSRCQMVLDDSRGWVRHSNGGRSQRHAEFQDVCFSRPALSRSACKAERRGTDAVGDGPGRRVLYP
ncbi:hypothetical protein C8Q70DRAFT_197756 [Cubamyces menziesii]|nr:hypothetical protein C8Q70DRAFT_197756 [Cubamyces menziesii]